MRRVRITKSNYYSFDGKVLWLNQDQEAMFPDAYAAALVSMKQAEYLHMPTEEPPVVASVQAEEVIKTPPLSKPVTKGKKP